MNRLTEDQRKDLVRAWQERDAARLAAVSQQLGVALSLEGLAKLERNLQPDLTARDVISTLEEALAAPHGLALREVMYRPWRESSFVQGKLLCLAVRDGEKLTVEVGYAPNLPMTASHVWSELRPWYRELGRNQARARAWARSPSEGRVTFALTEPALAGGSSLAGSEGDALLAALIASPDDDEIRLVYADYLTERGDPRGELIARMIQQPRDQGRIDELLRDLGRHVAGEVAERATSWRIVRGFVEEVTMNAASFGKHGARLLQAHPIRHLVLKPISPSALAKLAQARALSGLRGLHLKNEIGWERSLELRSLGASAHLQSLEELIFERIEDEHTEWEEALAALVAPRLRAVVFNDIVSTRGLTGLARNPSLPALERIEYQAPWFLRAGSEGDLPFRAVEALSRSEHLRGLRQLGLQECRWLTPPILEVLLSSPFRLERLVLTGSTLDDSSATKLAASPATRSLHELEISRCRPLGEEGMAALLGLPHLRRLVCYAHDLAPEACARLKERVAAAGEGKEIVISGVTSP
jgi:uncharacterized protein (TIGR02996 family)